MMYLLPFWVLKVSVVLLSMQGQILICVQKINEGLKGLEGLE